MIPKHCLSEIKQVEEQLVCAAQENSALNLTNLVAVFYDRRNGSRLAVFNMENPPILPGFSEVLSIEQLLQDKRNLSADYNGILITFSALDLLRPDIITSSSRFFPIAQLYRRLGQTDNLITTRLNFARILFSILLAKGELRKIPPENSPTTWLKKTSKLFRLSLPALLEKIQVKGLVAIVPDKNFEIYLNQQRCSLVYVTTDNIIQGEISEIGLEEFKKMKITTDVQVCAAFNEVSLFNKGVNYKTAGFVDLRKELHLGPYSTDIQWTTKRLEDIKTTIKQLSLFCYQLSQGDNDFVFTTRSLSTEYYLADKELDDIVGIELKQNGAEFNDNLSFQSFYLTLPESVPKGTVSLDEVLNRRIKSDTGQLVASFYSLYPLFSTNEDHWLPLKDILLKLNQPQILARTAYLISRQFYKMPNSPIDAEKIINEAAVACHVYCLAKPYHYYWPCGDHRHHLLQSYKNIHEQLDRLINSLDDREQRNYYHVLKMWWNYEEHNFEQLKKLLEEEVKELGSIIPAEESEDTRQYSVVSQLYELFSVMLRIFSRAWQPDRLRERLLQAGYEQIVQEGLIDRWDVLDLHLDPKLPSPLFFESLGDFINLCETSYTIRIQEHDPHLKAKKLMGVGIQLCQRIDLNFERSMKTYRDSFEDWDTNAEGEIRNPIEEIPLEKGIDLNAEPDDLLLLSEHERLWMRSLYYSAIDAHAALINTLVSRPVHGKVTPTEATQYKSTRFTISLINHMGWKIEQEIDAEVILSVSKDYDIQSRVVRKQFGVLQPVEFTVAFRTSGDVALLFEYVIGKKKYYDEAWVHVIDIETQNRWIDNPYQYGAEIVNPKNHYGRRQELEKVLNHLRAMTRGGERQNFRLHGIKRSGKTSLLHMIRKVIEDPETRKYYHIPIEVNSALDTMASNFLQLAKVTIRYRSHRKS